MRAAGCIRTVVEASPGEDALRVVSMIDAHVVLLETSTAGPQIARLVASFVGAAPTAKIVVIAPHASDEVVLDALQAGAAGVLGPDTETAALVRTAIGVAAGEAAVSRRFATRLVQRAREDRPPRAGMRPVRSVLTAREWEVLDLASSGISKPAIAQDLSVTVGTVRSHLRSLARKLSIDAGNPAGAEGSERTGSHAPD